MNFFNSNMILRFLLLRNEIESDSESSESCNEKLKDIYDEREVLYQMIRSFATNDMFPCFTSINDATLMLFSTLKNRMYDVKNWSSTNKKDWFTVYKRFCEGLDFKVDDENEMACGDLLNLWEKYKTRLVGIMDCTLAGNHPDMRTVVISCLILYIC